MKKILAFMLAAVLAVSMAACGGQAGENNSGAADANSDVTVTDDEKTFDSSWADNEFAMQIAQPAFENWNVKNFTEGESWSIFVKDVNYNTVKDYADSLRSYGFNINEEVNDSYKGLGYVFEAENAEGYHAELYFEAAFSDTLNGSFSLKISKNS